MNLFFLHPGERGVMLRAEAYHTADSPCGDVMTGSSIIHGQGGKVIIEHMNPGIAGIDFSTGACDSGAKVTTRIINRKFLLG